jgi:hypothetical protein
VIGSTTSATSCGVTISAACCVCGLDPQRYRRQIDEYADAGFDHVYIRQVGPDQDGSCALPAASWALAAH